MKRYIIFAVAALLLATSCKVSNGSERKPIDIGVAHARETHNRLTYDCLVSTFNALVADAYLATDNEAERSMLLNRMASTNYLITQDEEGNIAIQYMHWNNEVDTLYNITTDGKLLREGGLWKMTRTHEGETTYLTSTEQGIEVAFERNNEEYYYDALKLDAVLANVAVSAETGASFDLTGTMEVRYSRYNYATQEKNERAVLTAEVTEPLHLENDYFTSGKIDIKYVDNKTQRENLVEMEYLSNTYIGVRFADDYAEFRNQQAY